MNYKVKISYREPNQGCAGMNLWLTHHLKLVYHQDWRWDYIKDGYIYKFKDEQNAVLFSLRWV
jgi:hypothetical protein